MRRSVLLLAPMIAAVLIASPASAGIQMNLAMTLTPASGVPGTAVTLAATNPCPAPPGGGTVSVLIANQPDLVNGPFLTTVDPAADGTWSFPTTIDAAAPIGTVVTFYAECQVTPVLALDGSAVPNAQPGSFTLASYDPVTFAVTAPQTSTTTTTSTTALPTTTTTTTTTATPPPAMTAVPDFMYPLESCQLTGSGFAPGTNVEITVYSTPRVLGNIAASPTGQISTVWQVPAGFEAGLHTVVMRGTNNLGAAVELSTNVTIGSLVETQPATPAAPVPVAAPRSTSGRLPTTGTASTIPMAIVGAMLLTGGAAAVFVARRRRAA